MNEEVFVYGTLMQGEPNHPVLGGGRLVGRGSVVGTLYTLGRFPGLRLEGDGRVVGEVYRVGDAAMRSLDRLEGVDAGFYARVRVAVAMNDGSSVAAWAYEINKEFVATAARLPSGDWRKEGRRLHVHGAAG
jgi:gamma-glutamylaminecyclotransferase